MYDHTSKKSSSNKPSAKSAAGEIERRGADRHMFTASAEVVDVSSGARFSTRTTDLGPGGCFVDTLIPFPVGTTVQVSVRKGETQFDTPGTVVYSQHGLGMGIAFQALNVGQREALETWLAELTGVRKIAFREIVQASHSGVDHTRDNAAAIVRLVRLMIGKGILTEGEGTSVLHDPVL
jgi:PilZ domain